MSKIKVVHYINQFYAGIGGEEKADYPVELRKGEVIGPGVAFKSAFGDNAEIIATIICGDEYFQSAMGNVILKISEWIKELNPDVVVAGPAFNAGRYGTACACVCSSVQGTDIPAFTGMYKDNPAVRTYKDRICIFPTKNNAAGMKEAVERMAPFALKLGRQETIGSAKAEGYMPNGHVPSPSARKHTGFVGGIWCAQSDYTDVGKHDTSAPVSQPKPTVRKPQSEFRSNLVIKRTNFDQQKRAIQTIAQNNLDNSKLDVFRTQGTIIPWNKHNVTGEEINNGLVSPLNEKLIKINERQIAIIREFQTIYQTFDYLDKEYIAGIVCAVQSAEKASYQAVEASYQAKDASDEALEAGRKAVRAQNDANQVIKGLQITVNSLCEFKIELEMFKRKLDSYGHLHDIDKLWQASQDLKPFLDKTDKQLRDLRTLQTELSKKITNAEVYQLSENKNFSERISELAKSKEVLAKGIAESKTALLTIESKIKQEIGELAKDISGLVNRNDTLLKKIEDEVEERIVLQKKQTIDHDLHTKNIQGLAEKQNTLSDNIDKIVDNLKAIDEKHEQKSSEIAETLSELNKQHSALENTVVKIIADVTALQEKQKIDCDVMTHKIKIAYAIAGTTAGISILHIILKLAGVL